jgi:hypothetical protein
MQMTSVREGEYEKYLREVEDFAGFIYTPVGEEQSLSGV